MKDWKLYIFLGTVICVEKSAQWARQKTSSSRKWPTSRTLANLPLDKPISCISYHPSWSRDNFCIRVDWESREDDCWNPLFSHRFPFERLGCFGSSHLPLAWRCHNIWEWAKVKIRFVKQTCEHWSTIGTRK